MSYITITNIQKSFKNKAVLNNINISVTQGEIFGLLGPSGAGKTTLMKIITGQLKPDKGLVFVNGNKIDSHHRLKNIGIVMDNTGYYERLTCYENLLLYARIYNVSTVYILDALEKVGLKGEGATPAGKLSKGMQQRLLLARAILHSPDILFLDEPTSGLDPVTAKGIHCVLGQLQKEGKTIFLTTHNMYEAQKLCNHVAFICDGSIAVCDEPEKLCHQYMMQKEYIVVRTDNKQEIFIDTQENMERLSELFKNRKILTIHSQEPNLEQIFVKLTGKRLEE